MTETNSLEVSSPIEKSKETTFCFTKKFNVELEEKEAEAGQRKSKVIHRINTQLLMTLRVGRECK